MRNKIALYNRINIRILLMLLLLFIITSVLISFVNQRNIRRLFEENFTERVLLTNALMAANVSSEDVSYFVELMQAQDDAFKRRQVQFFEDRSMYWEMLEEGAPQEALDEIFIRLEAFYNDTAVFKNEKYWETVDFLRHLKEVSRSTYLYVMAYTGLVDSNGQRMITYIFDAGDDGVFDEYADTDGLGTCNISEETDGSDYVKIVFESGVQMDEAFHYDGGYGELYYAYAPLLDDDGNVVAVLGTDLDVGSMAEAVSDSALLFNTVFLIIFVIFIVTIFTFLHKSITEPLSSLTNTARELSEGNVYSPTSESALKQRGEIGMLANAINDMSVTYQEMISSTGKLFDAANIGKLDVRNDSSRFKGDVRSVVSQINDTLDATKQYLNSIPEGIFIMSKKLETYFRNDQFNEYFADMSAAEFMKNMYFSDVKNSSYEEDAPKAYADMDADELHEYLCGRVSVLLEQENNNTMAWINGICFSIILRKITLLNEPVNSSILVIAINITDLMNEKENAQAAAEAKSDFLSRMSHEMRTPMNAIIGMTKIAETTSEVPRLRYCLSTIGTSSAHLLGIINDVLDMSKIEAGKFELECVPMNLEKMLLKVCNIVVDNMEKRGLKFNVILSKDLHLNYIADDLRLSQVVTNLLSNAMKFTPEGGRITLAVEETEQAGVMSTLRFSVTDSGIGMTVEQRNRLFNAFEQADGSVSRKYGGTGLGLAISKNIVEKMGGRIWVESEPGTGSSFFFQLALERSTHQDTVIFDGIRPEDVRLLLVESDDDIREHFLRITDSFGINADAAIDIGQALAFVQKARNAVHAYDIIFMDYDIPGINGIEAINKLSSNIDMKTLVMITTFLGWHQIEEHASNYNITKYITKPVFPSSILDIVNNVVGNAVKSLDMKTEKERVVPDLSDVNILLAEDVAINREIFLALLEDTHISVDCAENGFEAVTAFKENPGKYDLIVMDVQMPEMDGFQATQSIRALDIPNAKTIPIIAMTANAFKEDIDRCLSSGMNDHLAKPIDEEAMIEKIKHYVHKE